MGVSTALYLLARICDPCLFRTLLARICDPCLRGCHLRGVYPAKRDSDGDPRGRYFRQKRLNPDTSGFPALFFSSLPKASFGRSKKIRLVPARWRGQPFLSGWKMGFEPTTFGTTIRRSNQLNYIHRIRGAK